jgi:hypothetical protein
VIRRIFLIALAGAVLTTGVVLLMSTTSGARPRTRSAGRQDQASASRIGPNRILVGAAIAGVQLGDRAAAVRKILGKPDSVVAPYWSYARKLQGRVAFEQGAVAAIWTQSTQLHTSRRVGAGSSQAQLKRAYRRLQCRTARHQPAVVCYLMSRHGSRIVETDFLVWKQVVRAVEIYSRAQPRLTMS